MHRRQHSDPTRQTAGEALTSPSVAGGGVSRRLVLGGGAAAVGVGIAGLNQTPAAADSTSAASAAVADSRTSKGVSARAGIGFLQGVTDAYRTSGPRLAQSYYDGSGLNDVGFVYDNALTILGLLVGGDLKRAKAIGDGLIFAQENDDTFDDYRLRQGYHVGSGFVRPDGTANYASDFGLVGTAVGDMAWPGVALAQLAKATGAKRFLTAAVRIGDWIVENTYNEDGLGGYTFGETAGLQDHKSTEHNVDVYAFFRLLAQLTGKSLWNDRADHAWAFVKAVWNAEDGFFWTGSDDGTKINKNALQLPEDVQSWAWLAARNRRYDEAIDWAYGNLASTDTPLRQNSALTGNQRVTGAVFASGSLLTDPTTKIGGQTYTPLPDPAAVWFEGTGQLALALRDRDRGDNRAQSLLNSLGWAQRNLGAGQTYNGKRVDGGVVAASSNLDTGFGFGYYQHLHTAATAWSVFAASNANPYRFF